MIPLVVVLLGLTPYTVAVVEIDINDQLGDDKGSEEIQLSFYATMSSYDYLTNETVLKALNGTDFGDGELSPVEILLLVSDSQLLHKTDKVQLADMVKNCTKSNLDVWVWFVYDEVEGHYPAYENHEYMAEFKSLFDEWVSNYSLDIHGILFDNEMDDFINHLPADNVLTYLDGVLSHRQKVRQDWEDAVESYRTAAEDWKDQGYEIALVGMETSILDNSDGDPDIQQMYGIVNNPPDIWERVSFMFYRSCEYHTTPYGEDYLFNLARRHAETFGERAVVAIGCMGFESYDETDEIVKDIAILKYLGYSTVELFELGAFYREFGYEGLLPVLNSSLKGWKYPEFSIKFYTLEYMSRTLLFLADILLNLF